MELLISPLRLCGHVCLQLRWLENELGGPLTGVQLHYWPLCLQQKQPSPHALPLLP